MRLHHLMTYLQTQAWAMEPTTLARGASLLRQAMHGASLSGADLHAQLEIPQPEEREERKAPPRVAVIPVMGVIENRASSLGTSTLDVQTALRQAMADERVNAVLFDVDSPGGVVTGIPELADEIRQAAKAKPMGAFTGGMMASAAYWLGAATGQVTSLGSAFTGSIGVWTLHEDWSENLKNEGIKVTEITAGEFKTEDAPWKPLSEEAEAFLQSTVDQAMTWFVRSVATDRRATQTEVRNGFGQGRVLLGDAALKATLIDTVGTFDDAVAELIGRVEKQRAKARKASNRSRQIARAVMGG